MKQPNFEAFDMLKAMAIVNIFETSRPFGDYAACVVLNDGAGVSYGISQFTHRSGSLAAVVEKYLASGGSVGRKILEDGLPLLRRSEPAFLRAVIKDDRFRKALRGAAVTHEMREAQLHVAFERYLKPAADACDGSEFVLPLSLAVVYDSMTHGSYEKIRDRVGSHLSEKSWITEYVRKRDAWLASIPRLNATRYRTRFFLNQIMLGKWQLDLPMNINGFWLSENHIRNLTAFADGLLETAVGPDLKPRISASTTQTSPNDPHFPASTPHAQPPFIDSVGSPIVSERALADARATDTNQNEPLTLDGIEDRVNAAAAKFDQADRIVTNVVIRTDRAKSLWTTVIGTIWQTAWAVFGFLVGLPREAWLVAAVLAAALMLFYLYRQIALGKIRETRRRESLAALGVKDLSSFDS